MRAALRIMFPVAAAVGLALTPANAAPKTQPGYGCFKVTAPSLNIRDKAFSDSAVIGTVGKGEILVKRKWYCTLRGFWCAVRYGNIEGWADKNFMTRVECPPRLQRQ